MSEVRGWSYNDMMNMSQPLFYRFYGYWYQDRLEEDYINKKVSADNKARENPRQLDSGQI
jgi:hypothetical protein